MVELVIWASFLKFASFFSHQLQGKLGPLCLDTYSGKGKAENSYVLEITVNEMGVEISWEVCQGSANLMQKFGLNSGLKRPNPSISANSVIKTVLPFPEPSLRNSALPKEANFKITILACGENDDHGLVGMNSEGEKTN